MSESERRDLVPINDDQFPLEEFDIVELEDRFEFDSTCVANGSCPVNTNCTTGCKPTGT
jgi:hypothetical protein